MAKKAKPKQSLYPSPGHILKQLKRAERILSSPKTQITAPSFAIRDKPIKTRDGHLKQRRNDDLRINRLLHGSEVYHSPRNRTRVIISNPITPDKVKLMKGKKRMSYDEWAETDLNED